MELDLRSILFIRMYEILSAHVMGEFCVESRGLARKWGEIEGEVKGEVETMRGEK